MKTVVMIYFVLLFTACSPSIKQQGIVTNIPINLTATQRDELLKSLAEKNKLYDNETKMLRSYNPPSSNHYHTNMLNTNVHAFREAASYALQLLDSDKPENTKRAIHVLDNLLNHQDTDSTSKTFGIWPYYLEEPLYKMPIPDWNWADFIGTELIEITLSHKHKLSTELNNRVKHAIICAAEAIKRRDVKPSYTNIAIMGTFVTYMAAELYDLPKMRTYANMRLNRFYDYTMKLKGFEEYNSPTYTMVALDELCRLKKCVLEPKAKRKVDELYKIAWGIIANHWHVTTAQLSGPHSRSYSDVLGKKFYSVLYTGSNGLININQSGPALNAYRLPHHIPDEYIKRFTEVKGETFRKDTFILGEKGKVIIGSTLLNPDFCLGTVNHSQMWQQRRPLLAYWGTKEKPVFFQIKFLHDFVEFSTANISSIQKGGNVLSEIRFDTNGGDYHIYLDRIDGTVKAKDLRLRFEFGDSALVTQLKPAGQNSLLIKNSNADLKVKLSVLYAVFDKFKGHFEVGATKGKSYIDWVAYSGKEKLIDFRKIKEAAMAFAVSIGSTNYPAGMDITLTNAKKEGNRLFLKWEDLNMDLPLQPGNTTEYLRWK